jgi:hypothetical protein
MELSTLGQLLAERTYVLLTSSGSQEEVVVRIGAPQESDRDWFCPFEIVGLGTPKIKCAFGVDAFQALQLTLKMIGVVLHHHRQRCGDGLYMSEAGDDLGFPEEAWTEGLGHQIVRAFGPVYGLKISIARNAGDMKTFQFGTITPHPSGEGTVGQYALHIQCPWRFVRAQRAWRLPEGNPMVTGSGDWWEPAQEGENFDWDDWSRHRRSPSVQENALAQFFAHYDDATESWLNVSDQLIIQEVGSDEYGGLDIHLSGDYRLQVFPDGESGEQWRLFQPGIQAPHIAFADGVLRHDQNTAKSEG